MLILAHSFQLTLEFVNIFHVSLQVVLGELSVLPHLGQRMRSVALQVVFMRKLWFVGWGCSALPLNFGQALKVIIATIEAESALMILQFMRSIEVQIAFETTISRRDCVT